MMEFQQPPGVARLRCCAKGGVNTSRLSREQGARSQGAGQGAGGRGQGAGGSLAGSRELARREQGDC